MDLNEFINTYKPQAPPSVTLIHGKEDYLVFRAYRKIIEWFVGSDEPQLVLKQYHGDDVDYQRVIAELTSPSLLSTRLLVTVRHCDLLASKSRIASNRRMLENAIKNGFAPGFMLLLTVSEKVSTKLILYKRIKEQGVIISFPAITEYDLGDVRKDRAYPYVKEMLDQAGKKIEPDAFEMLRTLVEGDLWSLSGELDKLIAYTGDRKTITSQDVKKVVYKNRGSIIFDLINHISQRQRTQGLATLQNMLTMGESPIAIVSILSLQMHKLLAWQIISAEYLKDDPINPRMPYFTFKRDVYGRLTEVLKQIPEELTENLASHPYAFYQMVSQAGKFTVRKLVAGLSRLRKIDMELKSSSKDPRILLEELILELCR